MVGFGLIDNEILGEVGEMFLKGEGEKKKMETREWQIKRCVSTY